MSDIVAALEAGEQCFICWEYKSDTITSCPQHFTCQTCFEKELVPRILYQQHNTSIHCSFPGCSFDYLARLSPSAKDQIQRNRTATKPRKFCPKCISQEVDGSLELGAFEKQTENRLVLDCKQCKSHFCLFCLEEISLRAHRFAHLFRKFDAKHFCKEESMQQLADYVRDKRNRCKPCPHCLALVHRTGGCSRMTCTVESGGCGNGYCFDCVCPQSPNHVCYKMENITPSRLAALRERTRLACLEVEFSICRGLDRIVETFEDVAYCIAWPYRRLIIHLEERRLQAYCETMRL